MSFAARCFVVLTLFVMPIAAVQAEVLRTLTWEDLTPPVDDLRKQFSHLKDDQLTSLYELYNMKKWMAQETDAAAKSDGIADQIKELETKLAAQKLDTSALIQKIDTAMTVYQKRKKQPIKGLDGQQIRIPGYVLPLEFGDAAVSEFFLVPYVGACIHTPPPPANQIVLVKLNQSYKPKGLYDPVWVTGKMKVVSTKRKLGYRDGQGDVETTYQLDGLTITPYKQ